MAEELWHKIGNTNSVHHNSYPVVDEQYLQDNSVVLPICINGKKRSELTAPTTITNEDLEKMAMANLDIQKWIEGVSIKKVIIVPKRMINIVVVPN